MVGYSKHMGVDEAGTLAALKKLRTDLIDKKIADNDGRIVKATGDGVLVEFSSVVNAVACAVEIQRAIHERNSGKSADSCIEFRIGINLGDVIVDGEDIYGDGVNVAVRIESIAESGGIAVSGSVRDHVGNRLDVQFEDRGEQQLKNIDKPTRVYNVLIDKAQTRSASATEAKRPSIAVLPFTNMSGDPEQEYFSDGITEDIITDLSKVSGLSVIARHSAFSYKGKPLKVQQVGRELGVAFVVEGSVRKVGARVRVTGQLVRCNDGSHVWAERFDRDLTDIFAIQDEITHAIVEQLKIKLLPQEKQSIEQAPTDNVEAYTYYLRGRQFLRRGSKAYYQLARQMFSKAAELDPLYARAYAGIADCDSFLFQQTIADITIEGILATSAKALALDNTLAEAHASQGFALQLSGRSDEATVEYEKAIALDPNSFEAHYFYGRSCFEQGDFEHAAALFERASEISQDDYQSLCVLIQVYRALDRTQDLTSAAQRGVDRAERELVLHPEDPRPAYLGAQALIALGESERARDWMARALAIAPNDILTQYNVATSYARLGETEIAIELLERALPTRKAGWRKWVEHDPDLDPLRKHPRFQKIIELTG
ncbi:MAG: adenylate cyclase [Verrucomicrobiota bacterium]